MREAAPHVAGFHDSSAYVSAVYDRLAPLLGVSLDRFKEWLYELHRARKVSLRRADLVQAMNANHVARSGIVLERVKGGGLQARSAVPNAMDSATFHLIETRGRRPTPEDGPQVGDPVVPRQRHPLDTEPPGADSEPPAPPSRVSGWREALAEPGKLEAATKALKGQAIVVGMKGGAWSEYVITAIHDRAVQARPAKDTGAEWQAFDLATGYLVPHRTMRIREGDLELIHNTIVAVFPAPSAPSAPKRKAWSSPKLAQRSPPGESDRKYLETRAEQKRANQRTPTGQTARVFMGGRDLGEGAIVTSQAGGTEIVRDGETLAYQTARGEWMRTHRQASGATDEYVTIEVMEPERPKAPSEPPARPRTIYAGQRLLTDTAGGAMLEGGPDARLRWFPRKKRGEWRGGYIDKSIHASRRYGQKDADAEIEVGEAIGPATPRADVMVRKIDKYGNARGPWLYVGHYRMLTVDELAARVERALKTGESREPRDRSPEEEAGGDVTLLDFGRPGAYEWGDGTSRVYWSTSRQNGYFDAGEGRGKWPISVNTSSGAAELISNKGKSIPLGDAAAITVRRLYDLALANWQRTEPRKPYRAPKLEPREPPPGAAAPARQRKPWSTPKLEPREPPPGAKKRAPRARVPTEPKYHGEGTAEEARMKSRAELEQRADRDANAVDLPVRLDRRGRLLAGGETDAGWAVLQVDRRQLADVMRRFPRAYMPAWQQFAEYREVRSLPEHVASREAEAPPASRPRSTPPVASLHTTRQIEKGEFGVYDHAHWNSAKNQAEPSGQGAVVREGPPGVPYSRMEPHAVYKQRAAAERAADRMNAGGGAKSGEKKGGKGASVGKLRVGSIVYRARHLPGAPGLREGVPLEVVDVKARDERIAVVPRHARDGDRSEPLWLNVGDVEPETRMLSNSKEARDTRVREAGRVNVYGSEPRFGLLEWDAGRGEYWRGDQHAEVVQSPIAGRTLLRLSEWGSGQSYDVAELDGMLSLADLIKRLYVATEEGRHIKSTEDPKVPRMLSQIKTEQSIGAWGSENAAALKWDGKYQEGEFRARSSGYRGAPIQRVYTEAYGEDLVLVGVEARHQTRWLGRADDLTLPALFRLLQHVAEGGKVHAAEELYKANRKWRQR